MRAAVAEVQRQNSAWTRAKLEWELYRQLPVLPRWADWGRYLSDMADDVLGGRAEGVNVIQIAPVPDVVDVSRLGFRKDGTSVYRPPGEARYVTAEHLDLEEWLLSAAKAAAVQRVTDGPRPPPSRETRRWTWTSGRPRRAADQPSGRCRCWWPRPGPARPTPWRSSPQVWTEQTGARVIGLTLAENAARVMAGEGMTEAHNIARFFAHGCPSARATSWWSTRRRRCRQPTWPGSSTWPTGRARG